MTTPSSYPKGHEFYINLVSYLKPAFSNIQPDKLDELSRHNYEYFRFMLTIDELIDEKNNHENRDFVKDLFLLK
jgi:hypothetical protein